MTIHAIAQKLKSLIRRESFSFITWDPYERRFIAVSNKGIYRSNDGKNWKRVYPNHGGFGMTVRAITFRAGCALIGITLALAFATCTGGCTPDPDSLPGSIEESR